MRVAVLCEFSGIVRDAFLARGHEAISCDLEPTEKPGPHIRGDCRDYDWSDYDLIIAHPPCTYLSSVGNGLFKKYPERNGKRFLAFDFCIYIWNLTVEKLCMENPVGYLNSHFQKPNQIVQPYYFGDPEQKTTCLWLRGLPLLIHIKEDDLFFKKTHTKKPRPTAYYKTGPQKGKPMYFVDAMSGSNKKKKKTRSRTFPGIAAAMAEQWGSL